MLHRPSRYFTENNYYIHDAYLNTFLLRTYVVVLGRFFNLRSYIAENTPYYMVDTHLNMLYTTRMVLKYFFCLSVHVTDKIFSNHSNHSS